MGQAYFFDGKSARDHEVAVSLTATGIRFEGAEAAPQEWRFADLEAIERLQHDFPFRLTNITLPGMRLVIRDGRLAREIIRLSPQLRGNFDAKRHGRTAAWVGGIVLAAALTAYVILQAAPQKLAFLMPDSWRDRIGEQVEAQIASGASRCTSDAGVAAMGVMAARIGEAVPDLPALKITVYDIPVMNAFAMPGERIVVTRELIRRANRPEQVAGVLAHEVGHVMRRHSEAQIVRVTGLQVLLGLITGGGGDTISSVAGLAAILTYTREAEAEADDIAIRIMNDAAIDPMGLKEFFEIILEEEGKPSTGAWGSIESAMSTHPGTADRIGKIKPLPDGVAARPVLSDAQWQALKAICD